MTRRRHRDRGESLVEVILAVVIIGISVSALVSGLATAANAGIVQRDSALADTLLRNIAEAAKAEGHTCVPGKDLPLDLTVPDGWVAKVDPDTLRCPEPTDPLRFTAWVTGPDGTSSSLDVVVRTP